MPNKFKSPETYQAFVEAKKKHRWTGRQCQICRYESFKKSRMDFLSDPTLSDKQKQQKLRLYGTFVDNILKDIKMRSNINSIAPCSKEHYEQAEKIRRNYRDGRLTIENDFKIEKEAIRQVIFGIVGLAQFAKMLYEAQTPTTDVPDEITKFLERALNHFNYRLETIDNDYAKKLLSFEID